MLPTSGCKSALNGIINIKYYCVNKHIVPRFKNLLDYITEINACQQSSFCKRNIALLFTSGVISGADYLAGVDKLFHSVGGPSCQT